MSSGALHLLLAATLATPPGADLDPSACAAADLRCLGRAYVAAARTATTPKQRAQSLYSAHRAFLHLYDTSQDSRDLCQAYDLIRQARKVPANQLGPRLEDSERETQSRLRSSAVECGNSRSSNSRSANNRSNNGAKRPPRAITTTESAREAPTEPDSAPDPAPASTPDPTPVPTATATERTDQALLQPSVTPPVSRPRLATRPQVDHRAEVSPKPIARPVKPLMIGGGVALGASLVLTGLTIYFPVRAAAARRACIAENCSSGYIEGDDQALVASMKLKKYSEYAAGGNGYSRDIVLGVVFGIAGAATLATAIALLTTGARRRSENLAIGPMFGPGARGLQFTGRF